MREKGPYTNIYSKASGFLILSILAGCDDNENVAPGVADGSVAAPDGGDAVVTPDAPSDTAAIVNLAPPAPGTGKQVTLETTLAANFETERCSFWRAPPEGLNIVREEISYTPGSHHAVLWMTAYQEIPATV